MKILIKKILKAVGSRMTYLLVGLSFSVIIIAVNAAMPAIGTPTVTTGSTLTSAGWNTMKTDLDNLKTAVDSVCHSDGTNCPPSTSGFTTCVTKTSSGGGTNTAGWGTYYSTVNCDTGWTLTGGGCTVNEWCWTHLMEQNYPIANGWYCSQPVANDCGNAALGRYPTAYAICCH